jgi:hypothetical protein
MRIAAAAFNQGLNLRESGALSFFMFFVLDRSSVPASLDR